MTHRPSMHLAIFSPSLFFPFPFSFTSLLFLWYLHSSPPLPAPRVPDPVLLHRPQPYHYVPLRAPYNMIYALNIPHGSCVCAPRQQCRGIFISLAMGASLFSSIAALFLLPPAHDTGPSLFVRYILYTRTGMIYSKKRDIYLRFGDAAWYDNVCAVLCCAGEGEEEEREKKKYMEKRYGLAREPHVLGRLS
jgi:hypothetical protein